MHSAIRRVSGHQPRSIAKKELQAPLERNVPKLTSVVVIKRQK